jgi:hypothetical protein
LDVAIAEATSSYDEIVHTDMGETAVKLYRGIVMALLVAAGGCASVQTDTNQVTEDGLTRTAIKGVDAAYVRQGTDFKQYRKILLDPVQVAFDKDWDPKRVGSNFTLSADERERIRTEAAELFMQVFKQELSQDGGIALVTTAAPDVLRLSTALVDVYVTAPDTMSAGRSRTYVMTAGRATLIAELRDSESGAILGRLFDSREANNNGSLRWSGSVQNSAEAQRMFTRWAQVLRSRIDAVRDSRGAGQVEALHQKASPM